MVRAGPRPRRPGWPLAAVLLAFALLPAAAPVPGPVPGPGPGVGTAGARTMRLLTLRDHNTRVVIGGTMLLGMAAGVVGTYMLLRKRALVGDALSHATLPGIALAFMAMVALGGTGKALPGLLVGAWISGLAGVGLILLIKNLTRTREDAALGIVLSVSFGLGVVLLGIIQKMPTGGQAGLESFIYGKAASMLARDALLIGATALVVLAVCAALYKEFLILSFDGAFAATQGWPTLRLDLAMMVLVTGVTVIGLQAVGLILIIALLITPAAAARFWTERLKPMLLIAGAIGAASGLFGAAASALVPRLPAGAIIVVVAATFFLVSLLFGAEHGALVRLLRRVLLVRSVARQHLLRATWEWLESRGGLDSAADEPTPAVPRAALVAARSWSAARLARTLRRARRRGSIETDAEGGVRLTPAGRVEAARVVNNHRLWELYLITHADIAPSHVDRDADQIEHVLGPRLVGELERLLAARPDAVPASPHALAPVPAGPLAAPRDPGGPGAGRGGP